MSVEADTTTAASLSKSFAWRNVANVLDELCDASAQAGIRLYYDLAYSEGAGKFVLTVKPYQQGVDRRTTVQLETAIGDVQDAVLVRDYAPEMTHVYVGGQGEGAARTLVEADAPTRLGGSPFGRRELFADRRQYTSSTGLDAEGSAELGAQKALVEFSGTINAGAWEFTKDFDCGDRLYVVHESERIDCVVGSVRVRLSDGREDVTAELRGYG